MVHLVKSKEEFHQEINKPNLTVVDYYAVWCGPCKMIAPHMETLAKENPDVNFIKVDVDELEAVAAEQGIQAMPTFHFFKAGKLLFEFKGADKNKLSQSVAQYKA